ncbi:MAG: hypothetical protein Q8L36_03480 [bacterium]|nr:hypothetical protein [bacterium]
MLYGFDKRIEEFKALIANDQLAQSYVFFGDPQIGKAFFARNLAYFLEVGDFNQSEKALIDYLEVIPELEKDSIGIEAVGRIKAFFSETPLISARRTVIVPEAERLTDEAQAALLKIVEEPPQGALIILVLPDPIFLTPPLASRCQKIYFPRMSSKEVADVLTNDYKIETTEAKKAALGSFGRLGRALAILGYNKDSQPLKADYFGEKIAAMGKRLPMGSEKLSWLLAREASMKRFNLNANLQQRAAEQYLTNN